MPEKERVFEKQPFFYIFLLILAGEAVFILPFVLARIFRPTFLDLFQVNNLELGLCFSVYGIVAVVAYFFGGFVADRFPPGKLMGVALILTGAGGFYLATYPSYGMLRVLYGYWGCTTILLFWAAMIKATRMWGGADRQGKAFGFLDGGRGLVAAGFGSLGLFVLGVYAVGDFDSMPMLQRQQVFQNVIRTFSGVVMVVGVLVFFVLRGSASGGGTFGNGITREAVSSLLKMRTIWLLMVIILTGYCGYKITDIFSLYAKDVMLYDEVKAAGIGTMLLYVRPVLGIAIGFMADRTASSLWLMIGFAVMSVGALVLALGVIGPSVVLVFGLSIFATSLGVYAIRSLYFAIMEEGSIPVALTGTAVGLASLVGYTPDIFMGPLIGVLLDSNPGELGHQYVFSFMAVMGLVGLIATILFRKRVKVVA